MFCRFLGSVYVTSVFNTDWDYIFFLKILGSSLPQCELPSPNMCHIDRRED